MRPAACVRAESGLRLFIDSLEPDTRVLDIGAGRGVHSAIMRASGLEVEGVDHLDGLTYEAKPTRTYGAIWCSHTLEHLHNVGSALEKMRAELEPDGLLAITVPPLKHAIVGGHVTLWNAGLLLYNLILAGFDCRAAAVRSYGYNISVLVRNQPTGPVELAHDQGDIERLAAFFPFPVVEGFDGNIMQHNWRPLLRREQGD